MTGLSYITGLPTNLPIEYEKGLNLFDAPDMAEHLFIGRQIEIQQMESILQPQSDTLGSSRKTLVLGGMGGIGKTQLAITYAKRFWTCYLPFRRVGAFFLAFAPTPKPHQK